MAEALAVAGAVTILKGTVGSLASALVKEVGSPVWNQKQTATELKDAIVRLEPIVAGISPSSANDRVRAWLEHLVTRLEAVKDILTANNKVKWYSGWNRYKTSKRLLQETELLRGLLLEANVVELHCTLAADEVLGQIREQVDVVREEGQEQWRDLAQTMRALVAPLSSHPFGLTASEAVSQVKDHADSITYASSGNCEVVEIQPAPSPIRCALRRQDSLTVFGGEEVVERAKELLMSEKGGSQWVGLCAPGGAGKTLAAQRIFNNVDIQAHFTGGCFWLTVSNAKTVMSLLRQLTQIMVGNYDRSQNSDMVELKNFLSDKLHDGKKTLLVLDDVWNNELLTWLDVLPREAGCKVLVTTRDQDLLKNRHADRLEVQLLCDEDSWRLFCWHACRGIARMPSELMEIAREIIYECKGLPLALKVIGGCLVGKTDVKFWKWTHAKLKNADVLSGDHEKQLYLQLKVSVDELDKIDVRLKDCFFYFAAFPEDYEVDVEEDLFPLWLGDGIVGKYAKYDPMDEACGLLGWLISRSLIELQRPYGGNTFKCKVHDVLRDLGRYMLQCKIEVEKRDCLFEVGADLKCFPVEWGPSPTSSDVMVKLSARRMSLMSNDVEKLPSKMLKAPKLAVLVLRNNPITCVPKSLFHHNLGNLKVLDLSATSITSLPSNIGILKCLVVLNLRATDLKKLPSSLGDLSNLEILNLNSCYYLLYLPKSVAKLSKLQHLRALCIRDMWVDVGWNIKEISQMRCGLKDLKHLAALKQLYLSSVSQMVLPVGFMKALNALRVLRLKFSNLVALPELASDDLQHLQVLCLKNCRSLISLPGSFGSVLTNLHTLNLSYCDALQSFPALDGLPNLSQLDMDFCKGLQSLPDSFGRPGAFPVLKELHMQSCKAIASFPELQPGAMPQLLRLYMGCWDQLVDFPKSFEHLTNIRYLDLSWCKNLQSLENGLVGVHNLPYLEELDVSGSNNITKLSASLAHLPKLRAIYMRQCLATVPQEVKNLEAKGRITIKRGIQK